MPIKIHAIRIHMLKYELRVASENNAKCVEIPVPFIHFKYVNEEH